MVIRHLETAGFDFVRFNTEEFPQKVLLEMWMKNGQIHGALRFPERAVEIGSISCVWNRRPHKPEIDPRVATEAVRSWAEEESYQGLQILWSLIEDRFWLNSMETTARIDFNKWLQMKAAAEVGLTTPPSLMTNNPAAALMFWQEQDLAIALKAIKQEVIRYPEQRKPFMITTKKLGVAEMKPENLEKVAVTPVFLQRYIEKEKELRITVVGNQIFSCEIDSQQMSTTQEDWRAHIFEGNQPPLKPCILPAAIGNKCLKLLAKLDLSFGCIDMIVTPQNNYVFLEVNPNGQWAWVEQQTGLPISTAIAQLLACYA